MKTLVRGSHVHMDDAQFRKILDLLDLSWKGYRKVRKGVQKRLRRHMRKSGYSDSEAYIQALHSNHQLRKECERLMTVSISRFFRDLNVWQTLEKEIMPVLIGRENEKIKIWSAGCACGEEVYSIKIVLTRLKERFAKMPDHEILATDLNPVYLERARIGVYPKSSLKEVPAEWLTSYFVCQAQGDIYAVASFLKKDVTWKVHNLLSDPGHKGFNIIFMRNSLLTYYQDDQKISALHTIINQLAPAGFFIIGSHEKLPPLTASLSPFGGQRYIFRKATQGC